jgi:hypothetical protein
MTDSNAARNDAAETSKQPPRPSSGSKRLNVFVGAWKAEGQQHQGPIGPAAKITAVETFEWLAGELFLVHRFDGRVGEGEAACIEIIGHDAESQSYPTHTYYNNGIVHDWQSQERDGIWTLSGEWQMAGKAMKVRCTTVFSDGGDTRTAKWEISRDGASWQTFWDVTATKAR